jgi:hypothetical protein
MINCNLLILQTIRTSFSFYCNRIRTQPEAVVYDALLGQLWEGKVPPKFGPDGYRTFDRMLEQLQTATKELKLSATYEKQPARCNQLVRTALAIGRKAVDFLTKTSTMAVPIRGLESSIFSSKAFGGILIFAP